MLISYSIYIVTFLSTNPVFALLHDAEPIAAPHLLQVLGSEAFGKEKAREVDEFGSTSTTWHTAIAIEVGTNAHVVDASDINHMEQVLHAICYGSRHTVFFEAEKTVIECDLRHTTSLGKSSELVIGQVSWVITHGAARSM